MTKGVLGVGWSYGGKGGITSQVFLTSTWETGG